jgi:hypothetical protein
MVIKIFARSNLVYIVMERNKRNRRLLCGVNYYMTGKFKTSIEEESTLLFIFFKILRLLVISLLKFFGIIYNY